MERGRDFKHAALCYAAGSKPKSRSAKIKKLLTIFLVAFVVLGIAAVASQAILLEDFDQNVKNLVVLNYILPRIGVAFLSGLFYLRLRL